MTWDLLLLPLLACLVLTGIHAYLGLHVLARGVIFVDLALAQVAALGMTAALLAGHAPESNAAYAWALGFTVLGALLFALTRENTTRTPKDRPAPRNDVTRDREDRPATRNDVSRDREDRPGESGARNRWGGLGGAAGAPQLHQEAIIGIVYAVAAAVTVLVLDRVAQGGEQIKQLLVGSLLGVTRDDVVRLAGLYALVGALHWLCRRPLLSLSLGDDVRGARAWDFVFYLTFGLVVTSSVRIAGVLLVFSYLIVPAVIGTWLADTIARRLAIGWTVGVVASVAGLGASFVWDLPAGATVVAVFGALLALVAFARALARLVTRMRRDGRRALAGVGVGIGVVIALAGLALAALPHADHLWLDALERGIPRIQLAFLSDRERRVDAEARAAIAHGTGELAKLRALAADVRWGHRDLPAEERERLRQFLAGRDELVAGDRLVLATLRARARERQRFVLGLPLAVAGAVVALASLRGVRH
ncbi:MAG TPA: metal ABC transporter permease [Candidatus Acidoferrum sp.]|nr:metal ABC transporter permease [Candidatus Acidoferrum sp.]